MTREFSGTLRIDHDYEWEGPNVVETISVILESHELYAKAKLKPADFGNLLAEGVGRGAEFILTIENRSFAYSGLLSISRDGERAFVAFLPTCHDLKSDIQAGTSLPLADFTRVLLSEVKQHLFSILPLDMSRTHASCTITLVTPDPED